MKYKEIMEDKDLRRTYSSWRSMRQRCKLITSPGYEHYGGRGISVCDVWNKSFNSFLRDMGIRPENATLDRIDVNGNYEPNNCRWVSWKEQARNKRNNVYLEFNGEKLTLQDWSKKLGIRTNTLTQRYRSGWDVESMLTAPEGSTYRGNNQQSITYNGVTKSLVQWAKDLEMCPRKLRGRIKSGWSVERSLFE